MAPTEYVLLHPACQCATMTRPRVIYPSCHCGLGPCRCVPHTAGRRRTTARKQTLQLYRGPNHTEPWHRLIVVPEWTSSQIANAAPEHPQFCMPPRFVMQRKEDQAPFRLQGEVRFARGCRANIRLQQALTTFMVAVQEYAAFLLRLSRKLEEYFGTVGLKPGYRQLLDDVALSWDLEHLCLERPTAAHVQAFIRACSFLRPCLQRTYWPEPGLFPYVQRSWPSENNLAVQYVAFCCRLRWRVQTEPVKTKCSTVSHYEVRRVTVAPVLNASIRLLFLHFSVAQRRGLQRIMLTIGKFLFGSKNTCQGETFQVSVTSLCCVGHSANWAHARAQRKRLFRIIEGQKGDVATICGSVHCGFVVQICKVKRRFCQQRLAASLDLDPLWHCPDVGGIHCYHAVRVGHRFRFITPPETCCESWGSLIHILYDDMRCASIERLVARLFLKEAQLTCAGSSRDDAVVEVCFSIAECLVYVFLILLICSQDRTILTNKEKRCGICAFRPFVNFLMRYSN